MALRDILYLTIDTLLDVVIENNFLPLYASWYLFGVVSSNRYPEVVMKIHFVSLALVMYLLPDGYYLW